MAYTPGFDHDIFISFSHEDNKPRPGERGWIEQFREYLEWWLTSRRGLKDLRIWWDKERLGGNTDFDERIERDLGNTALFFVIHSHNYRDSDYCAKELDWYVDKARRHPVGLSVNGERRIFNILINNIPHTDWTDSGHWTKPLAGTIGFPFHDGEKPEDYGDPIEPEDRKRFDEAMRRIVDDATRLLKSFPKAVVHPSEQPSSASAPPDEVPTLFVADVSEGGQAAQASYPGDRGPRPGAGSGPATLAGGRARSGAAGGRIAGGSDDPPARPRARTRDRRNRGQLSATAGGFSRGI